MKTNILTIIFVILNLFVLAQTNINFAAQLQYPGHTLSNIWGYVDTLGNEYALVGTSAGLSIVDVTVPSSPVEKFTTPGPTSIWREVKTWGKYAYVTTEGGGGLQVVNLSYLPDSIQYYNWTGNGVIAGLLNTIHAIHIDNDYAYLYGSNLANGGAIIVDLSDPQNLNYVGEYNGEYIHDGYVRNDTLWGAHIMSGFFSVIDVTNKSSPVLIAIQTTPGSTTHNTWLSDNGKVLFTTDEVDDSYLTSYDITDLANISELDRIQFNAGSNSMIHNTHILNDYAVTSWYKDGVVIVDCSRPDNLIEVGNYDTNPLSGGGSWGCWGVYPYLPSGTIVASDMGEGLFVLAPTYKRGCYLEGIVTDSITANPLYNVNVEILSTSIIDSSGLTGEYKMGTVNAGVYDIIYSLAGYNSKTVTNVNLTNGVVTNLDVQLKLTQSTVQTLDNESINFSVAPNPFSATALVHYKLKEEIYSGVKILLTDVVGRAVQEIPVSSKEGTVSITNTISEGLYYLNLFNGGRLLNVLKIIKM